MAKIAFISNTQTLQDIKTGLILGSLISIVSRNRVSLLFPFFYPFFSGLIPFLTSLANQQVPWAAGFLPDPRRGAAAVAMEAKLARAAKAKAPSPSSSGWAP